MYTTLRLHYGMATKSDFFKSKSSSFELGQSINLNFFDFYGSMKFYLGEVTFVKDNNGYALPTYSYKPSINNYEAILGFDLIITKNARLTSQFNFMEGVKSLLIKFSLGISFEGTVEFSTPDWE